MATCLVWNASPLHAQTATASGNWSDPATWDGTVPNSPTAEATLNKLSGAGLVITVNGTFDLLGLTSTGVTTNSGAAISGGTLNFADNGFITVDTSGTNPGFLTNFNNGTTLNFTGETTITVNGTQSFWLQGNSSIQGAGSTTFAGTGTSILSGNLSTTGATTISSGAVLRLGFGRSHNSDGALLTDTVNNGTLIFRQAGNHTHAGDISGTGTVTKEGTGILILTGTNTYTGGTTISISTLQLGNGGTTGMVAGNITNNGNLAFNRVDDYFFNGIVSGTGNFTQRSGILRLSAAQTYTGNTRIQSNSILVLPFIDQSLSNTTIVNIWAGSSLDFSNSQLTISGLTGSGTVYSFLNGSPATGNLTLDIASGTSTFDGSFGGPHPNFSITKAGAGTQIFTGNSTHTGTTTVSVGALLVNGNLGNSAVTVQNNALLGGSGILGGNLTIESGGILAPGNSTGIITIGGNLNLNGGSITQMEINGTTPGTGHDQIVVDGTASLAGTLELFFGGGMTNGDTFTLIDTANPITGNYDSVVNVLGNALTFSTTITDDYLLSITAVQTDYEPFAETPNQQAVATTIDDQALSGDLNDLIDFLNTLPGTSLPAAFDEIAPTQFAFLPDVVFAKSRFRQRGLAGQMRERRGGSSGMSTSRLQVSSASGSIDWINSALMAPRHERNFVGTTDSTAAPMQPSADNRWGFFASGTFEHIDDDRNGPGNQSNGGGLTLGADVQLNDSTIIGFFAGYEHSDLDFGANGGDVTASAATYGLYGTWFDPSGNWLEGSLGGGYHRFNTTRNVFGDNANSKTNANEFMANITYGHDIGLGSRSEWTLTPSAGLSYNYLKTDGFTETGSLAPLTLQSQTAESLCSEIGLRLDYRREWSGVTWLPYVHCGWQHEFLDTSQSINARFATGGGIFTVNGPSSSRNTAVFGTGINAIFSDTLSAGIGYNGEANNNFQIHQVFASLRMRF